jgi:hypothetical protein
VESAAALRIRALAKRPWSQKAVWYHCAALTRTVVRGALLAVVGLVLTAAPALAQTSPNPVVKPIPKAPPPWTYYMAILTIALAGLTLIMAVIGYLVQAPGFRRGQRSGAS